MVLEMWHMFIISNIILLSSTVFHSIRYEFNNKNTVGYLYSCLFVAISIGLLLGTLVSTIHYDVIKNDLLPIQFVLLLIKFTIICNTYIALLMIPLTLLIPDKKDFKKIIRKYKHTNKIKRYLETNG